MPAEGQDELSPADQQTIRFIERGEVTKACKPATTNGPQGEYDLPRRLLAGEELLHSLGLTASRRAQTGEDVRNGILLLKAPKASRLILVFNGNTINFSLPKPLLRLADTQVMLIRDPGRCFGFAGVVGRRLHRLALRRGPRRARNTRFQRAHHARPQRRSRCRAETLPATDRAVPPGATSRDRPGEIL